jgi:hypothetical protein
MRCMTSGKSSRSSQHGGGVDRRMPLVSTGNERASLTDGIGMDLGADSLERACVNGHHKRAALSRLNRHPGTAIKTSVRRKIFESGQDKR